MAGEAQGFPGWGLGKAGAGIQIMKWAWTHNEGNFLWSTGLWIMFDLANQAEEALAIVRIPAGQPFVIYSPLAAFIPFCGLSVPNSVPPALSPTGRLSSVLGNAR